MAIDLQIEGLSKSFGALVLFENISFSVEERQRIGLIARNGKGKSTLLKIIAGGENYDSGSIVFRKDLRVGYLEQEPHFEPGLRVIDACLRRNGEVADAISRYERVAAGGDEHELHAAIEEMERLSAWDYETKVKQVLSQLKINDFNQKVETLSGGQMKRVALASVLLEEPDLMILDEPTNDLNIDTLQVLEEYLADFKGCVIVVSHDRYFMDKVVDHIFVFNGMGDIKDFPGNYTDYRDWREEEKATAIKSNTSKNKPQKEQPEKPAAPAAKRKMSFKEKREFEALEQEIPLLEQEKAQLETEMSSGTLDGDTLVKKSMRIAELIELIDEKSMRWLELSELG